MSDLIYEVKKNIPVNYVNRLYKDSKRIQTSLQVKLRMVLKNT